MKYTIKQPELMTGVNSARYNPNVIIAILISVVIYLAYAVANAIAGFIYTPFYLMQHPDFFSGGFGSMTNIISDLGSTPSFILMCLFLFAFLIFFTIIEVRFIEKRPLSSIGLGKKRFALKYFKGFGVGTLLLIILIIPTVMTEWNNIAFTGFKPLAIWFFFAFMVQTAGEEILFRGYLLTSFGKKIGMFWAVMLSSLLFALLHISNGDATLFGIISIFCIGVLLGFYMVRDNNIWGAIGIHAAWNFVQGLFSGLSVGFISMDYSAVYLGEAPSDPQLFGIVGDPSEIVSIIVLLAAIAVVLFVGKNKIVVRKDYVMIAAENEMLQNSAPTELRDDTQGP